HVGLGLVCLLEAALGFAAAFLLPLHAAVVAEPAIGISSVVGLLIWTTAYARARQARRQASTAPLRARGKHVPPADGPELGWLSRDQPDRNAPCMRGSSSVPHSPAAIASALRIGPNSFQLSPLKRIICICSIGP